MTRLPLPLRLDRDGAVPLRHQLSDQIREVVSGGSATVGDRLPSSRALARDLGVSRALAEQAYDQLVAEGWLEGRHGSGTYVAASGVPRPLHRRPRGPAPGPAPIRLDTGTPWIDPRHVAAWRRAWREVSTATPPRGYDDSRGLPELRVELAAHLGRTRGLDVDPDELVVTAGTVAGLRHLLAALPAGPVAVEDPGYRAAVETIRTSGRTVLDLPALGPVTDLEGAVAAYVTPAHQHPLGRVMSGSDRLRLLDSARAAGAVVVEDDYDSEFRYDVAPVPALATLDRDRVAYLGTSSKSVLPSLRLGWLVPPPSLLERVTRVRENTHDGVSWPVQRAFVSLLRDGYVDKVVRSARRVYAARAPRVVAALAPYGEMTGPVAGMYATVLMPIERAARAHRAALAAGLDVPLLADYCRSHVHGGLIVGFGGCTDDELDRALTVLGDALSPGCAR
jgi:GntR family transcriptional regulator/MocR family aminotransferase